MIPGLFRKTIQLFDWTMFVFKDCVCVCDQFTVLWLLTKIYTLEVLLSLHPNSLVSKINIVRDYSILKEIYVSSQLTDGVPKHPHQVSCSSHRVASFQFGMPLGYFWQEKCMLFCAAVELI